MSAADPKDLFDQAYVQPGTEKGRSSPVSALREFIKKPMDESDLRRYGTSKPQRIIIKAKISR
jgi:hypothetical protein